MYRCWSLITKLDLDIGFCRNVNLLLVSSPYVEKYIQGILIISIRWIHI